MHFVISARSSLHSNPFTGYLAIVFCLVPDKCVAYVMQKVMVTLTNTYGYLSCIFALSTPGTELVYIKCAECVGYPLSNGCSNAD